MDLKRSSTVTLWSFFLIFLKRGSVLNLAKRGSDIGGRAKKGLCFGDRDRDHPGERATGALTGNRRDDFDKWDRLARLRIKVDEGRLLDSIRLSLFPLLVSLYHVLPVLS